MLIYTGKDYAVRRAFLTEDERQDARIVPIDADVENAPVVVTFPHAGPPTMNADRAFGEVFLRHKGIDAYHILNAQTDWFQSPDILRAIEAIRSDLPPGRPVVTYGSSMGGYGALLGSGPLDAARVLAVAPQFSIDRDIVPTEVRWSDHAARIGTFIHDIEARISSNATIYTLHDPRNYDQLQMNMFAARTNWTRLYLPYGGHTPLIVLQQGGILTDLIDDIIYDRMDVTAWRPRLTAARRHSRSYWRVMSIHAARVRRFDFAWYCFANLEAMGGTPSECAATRGAIERNMDMRRRQAENAMNIARRYTERDARLALRANLQNQPKVPASKALKPTLDQREQSE